MQRVAEKLKDIAISEADRDLRDLYAKSSYNRYYYHCYKMTIREVNQLSGTTPKNKLSREHASNILQLAVEEYQARQLVWAMILRRHQTNHRGGLR